MIQLRDSEFFFLFARTRSSGAVALFLHHSSCCLLLLGAVFRARVDVTLSFVVRQCWSLCRVRQCWSLWHGFSSPLLLVRRVGSGICCAEVAGRGVRMVVAAFTFLALLLSPDADVFWCGDGRLLLCVSSLGLGRGVGVGVGWGDGWEVRGGWGQGWWVVRGYPVPNLHTVGL